MKITEKENGDAGAVHLPFDAAMTALATGAYETHPIEGERGPDVPGAQTPKPGTKPVDGSDEVAAAGSQLTNVPDASFSGAVSSGLPKEPAVTEADKK